MNLEVSEKEKSERVGVVLIQLGTPSSPDPRDVREFLRVFLGDPRVVDLNPFFWKIILNCFILPTRPKKVAEAYEEIWDGEQFPLKKHSENYAVALQDSLNADGGDKYRVRWAAVIGNPTLEKVFEELFAENCDRIRIIPQFPQYSEATTTSVWDRMDLALERVNWPEGVEREQVEHYESNPALIETLAVLVEETLKKERPEKLLFSFHGYPTRRIKAGDPYFGHCITTAQRLAERLKGKIDPHNIVITFQSKFGSEQWLEPGTEETLVELAEGGTKRVAVLCPAFTVDCLETDEEIGIGLKEVFLEAGGESFTKIDSLNDHPVWVEGSAEHLVKPPIKEIPKVPVGDIPLEVPEQILKVEPLDDRAKTSLKSIFLVLFIDLIGFSIIFPLFPRMLEYYGQQENQLLFGAMMNTIHTMESWMGGSSGFHVVLFGGLLGSLYSFLQFLCSPILGSLSDRFGRRPILILSLSCIALSYLGWFFAASFELLVISRLIGGAMSGNIATATAVVGDVTKPSNRSRGMALIGVAFGLGFILGPALGAFASYLDLTAIWPSLAAWGVNPFSTAAGLALALTLWNLWMVLRTFKETLPPEKRGKGKKTRSINPFVLFRMEKLVGVSRNNLAYFFFLLAFSGMEFTLTFLTFERLEYTNIEQGWMFVFIGLVLVLMQGGYVRRKASVIGERKMAFRGMVFLIPGLVLLGFAEGNILLYLGLFFMAVGSAQVIPCLTTLASQYAPPEEQGRVTGVFRSLGALARAFGPIVACFLYWRVGSLYFYLAGAAFVILPLILVRTLPAPPEPEGAKA